MEKQTIWTRIRDLFTESYYSFQWYITKKCLDRTFGKKEYWGDEIMEGIIAKRELKDFNSAKKTN